MMAPRMAAGAAMRSAANRLGSAARSRTLHQLAARGRRRRRGPRRSMAGSALRRPTSIPTSVVKNTAMRGQDDLGRLAVEGDLQDRARWR